jgi:hypothetical protein
MKTIHVEVTQEDIDEGQPLPSCCPIAMAVCRATGLGASVFGSIMELWNIETGDARAKVTLPSRCVGFVDEFDSGITVSPFAFDIEVPE